MVSLADSTACQLLRNSRSLLLGLAFLLTACTGAQSNEKETLPFYNSAEFDADWIPENDLRYETIHTIADFSLTDQRGRVITGDSLWGSIYVANFFYSICPGICPKMMSNLKSLQDTFAVNPSIKLVSFSVMPWADSVGRLREYGLEHGINPTKWHLLTGPKETIYTLGRNSFFAEKTLGMQKDATQFLHTESMLLIDPKGRIRGIYNATQKVDIERITDDIRTLLRE